MRREHRSRRSKGTLILLASLILTLFSPGRAAASPGFRWEFFDFSSGQTTTEFPLDRQVELILASDDADVRQALPITFQVRVNGRKVYEQTASDPRRQCRGPTGCSVPGPPPNVAGPTDKVEIVALDRNGNELSRSTRAPAAVESPSPAAPSGVTIPETIERPSTIPAEFPVCWWCWGLKLLFVAFLVCILIHYVIKTEWWDWWILWFILIFIWIPIWLAWFFFFAPWWWWIPQLIWFPLIGYLAFRWMRLPWWRPWMGGAIGGWWVLIALGLLVWKLQWWWLLPVLWVPWVAIYVLYRGMRRPWWKPWLLAPVAAYVFWVFAWFIWLGPLWAWVIPFLVVPVFLGWFLAFKGTSKKEWWSPKLCFVLPWAWFPWLAFMNTDWDPWWCWVVIGFVVLTMLCVIFHWVRNASWWVWWELWAILIFLWTPLILAVPLFFNVWWWWLPLLGWFPAIFLVTYFWAMKQPWWKPNRWFLAAVWVVLLVAGMILWGRQWWFVLPLFWLPWIAFFIGARAMRRPYWRPWLWLPIAGWVFWVFAWIIWLTPFWWWVFFAAPAVFFLWWVWWTKQTDWKVIRDKVCVLFPWFWLPAFAFAVVIYYCQLEPRNIEIRSATVTIPPTESGMEQVPTEIAGFELTGTHLADAFFGNRTGSNECPPQFTDNSYTVDITDSAIRIIQRSTGQLVQGTITPDGNFEASSPRESFRGQIVKGPPGEYVLTADYQHKDPDCGYLAKFNIKE